MKIVRILDDVVFYFLSIGILLKDKYKIISSPTYVKLVKSIAGDLRYRVVKSECWFEWNKRFHVWICWRGRLKVMLWQTPGLMIWFHKEKRIQHLRDNAMGFYKTVWTVYVKTYMNMNIKVFSFFFRDFPDLVRTALNKTEVTEKHTFPTIFKNTYEFWV